jgi:AraC-like DNA-binding protein/mannose-6-phosphate isomerase-like protein (cupin superfamily)
MNVRVTWFEQAFGHAKIWSATGSRTASSREIPAGSTGDQSLYGSSRTSRTFLTVHQAGGRPLEVIQGAQSSWRFRPHFHAGDEIVRLLAGRARLRLQTSCREVAEGETVVVPAGMVHRFEPLDDKGWAFASEFVLRPANTLLAGPPDAPAGDGLVKQATMMLAGRHSLQTDVDSIARDCAVSAGHLARAFRRATGTSLHNFHVLLAVHKAKARLREGAPLIEAALDGGFYDQAHLTREFVRTFGMTPGTFRSAWMAR